MQFLNIRDTKKKEYKRHWKKKRNKDQMKDVFFIFLFFYYFDYSCLVMGKETKNKGIYFRQRLKIARFVSF